MCVFRLFQVHVTATVRHRPPYHQVLHRVSARRGLPAYCLCLPLYFDDQQHPDPVEAVLALAGIV